jgi:hypothetical protein
LKDFIINSVFVLRGMAYHEEDLIDLGVFDIHENDSQLSIHSIDAADQRLFIQQADPLQAQTSVDVIVEIPSSIKNAQENPLRGSSERLPTSKTRDVSPPTDRESVDQQLDLANSILMIVSLLFGVGLAVAHHFYYCWLNGQVVGDSGKQQWALR